MGERVLVIAAHPDDEVVGVGGTIAKHAAAGDAVHVLFVTTGQRGKNDPGLAAKRKQHARACNDSLGTAKIQFAEFVDTDLDQTPHRELNAALEGYIDEIEPSIVYTHAHDELHLDHQAVHNSTLVATRPGTSVKQVLAYELPSSTNRTASGTFHPTTYVDITAQLATKIEGLLEYEDEIGASPHPRSEAVLRGHARSRGTRAGYDAAEAFQLLVAYCDSVREIS